MLRKTISFSLWGNNPKYTVGAIRNAELTNMFYKDWILKYYIGSSVPNQIIYSLEEFSNVEIVEKKDLGNWTSMFWRFEACYDDNSDIAIFRDTDSRFSFREEAAVNEWIDSNKNFHIMRDHPYHKFPILGGMWGIKKSAKYNIRNMLETFIEKQASDQYGTDYKFLGNVLYPQILDDVFVHDEFFGGNKFPLPRENYNFVGQVFDHQEQTVLEHLEAIKKAVK